MPLLVSCTSFYQVKAEEDGSFVATSLTISEYNSSALNYRKTSRGVKIEKSGTSTDAFLRFDGINQDHAVNAKDNKYIAIRYRANFDPKFVLRIKSTTGFTVWNDFLFSSGERQNTVGTWSTYVYKLSLDKASNISASAYSDWESGDYLGVSFNIVNKDDFALSTSYLYISSFAFFDKDDLAAANSYSGLDYASSPDTKGPEITIPFGDGQTFNTTAGKKYTFTADAYDEYDDIHPVVNVEVPPSALDGEGKLVEGNHTVTFTASDLSGNESVKVLNLVVGPKDTVPPVINCNLETIYVPTGTYNCLAFTAYDAEDGEIKCEYLYSANALDENNRFVKGNHTLTIKATDLTGNFATKDISVVVDNNIVPNGLEVIEEEK